MVFISIAIQINWSRIFCPFEAFNVFVIQVYIKNWYTFSCGELVPYNDLNLIKELNNYRKINTVIADAVIKCFLRHLWYLSVTLSELDFWQQSPIWNESKYGNIISKKRSWLLPLLYYIWDDW